MVAEPPMYLEFLTRCVQSPPSSFRTQPNFRNKAKLLAGNVQACALELLFMGALCLVRHVRLARAIIVAFQTCTSLSACRGTVSVSRSVAVVTTRGRPSIFRLEQKSLMLLCHCVKNSSPTVVSRTASVLPATTSSCCATHGRIIYAYWVTLLYSVSTSSKYCSPTHLLKTTHYMI